MVKGGRRRNRLQNGPARPDSTRPALGLRIIGGQFRGRKLQYGGDLRTRPMKDRVREAIFNLVGPAIRGKHAVDLFAGTGALGIEAISRGAAWATLIEQHHPTANVIHQNIAVLGTQQQTEVIAGNAFLWLRRQPVPTDAPWVVFCSPPYDFYVSRTDEMLNLIAGLIQSSPADSILVVESDARFDFLTLPDANAWDVRTYSPAVVGIYRK